MSWRAQSLFNLRLVCWFAGSALVLTPGPAWAQETIVLRADVVRSCHLGALPMMFGTVSIINPQANAQTALIIDCTPNTTFTVTMDDGLHAKNGKRRMSSAPFGNGVREFLEYEIYRNAARTLRWGSTPATGITQTAPADGKVTLTAYGHADGKRAVSAPYEDIVTVTIIF